MLIGRQSEAAAISERPASHRLVTLIGPGGVGKTALARQIVEAHPAGDAHFVDLAGLTADDVREAVAGILRFRSYDDMPVTGPARLGLAPGEAGARAVLAWPA